jgi:hypothetical protein
LPATAWWSRPIGYDDYRRVDVSGKAVVVFSHEPQERLSGSAMNGARPVMESTLTAKEGPRACAAPVR